MSNISPTADGTESVRGPGASDFPAAASDARVPGGSINTGGDHRATAAARHAEARIAGRASYADPATGYSVFTVDYLRGRGTCCETGCRHCPYIEDDG